MNKHIHEIRILLVEDEHFLRSLILHALTNLGFSRIYEAQDGDEALGKMSEHTFDLVITDIEMKPKNGLELVRLIRSGHAPIAKETKVIFLTGFSDFSTLSSATGLDIQGFLVKPASAKQLKDKVLEALKSKIELKDPDEYMQLSFEETRTDVRGDRIKDSGNHGEGSATAPGQESSNQSLSPDISINEEQSCKGLLLEIHDIQPGMILCEDIVGRGVLLLSKGTVLEKGHIQVIKDMSAILSQKKILVEDRP